uniref:Putative addiction module component, TIGR02574 family n=1 Tax=Candidatus Kentrum sp. MB TaxID=2138164 RepID=A0A450WZT9_9GAMM|nr:MAG: putative addiction module component, TIGR02574 family [Candidatus Kentron sp. MB]VFK28870.1 MAG: putative addiction module component, TIGR02574 family [Candidatus Kentron sp. MB]VFK74128.1 MAG: putative addiction module component, TIGR02574 family [Candidatus Kentron sp. MB]
MNLQQIQNEALHLPKPERAELAQKLLDSLDAHAEPDRVSVQWLPEAQRRARELDNGIVRSVPSEEVARKARALDTDFLHGLEGTLREWASEVDEEAWREL